MTPLSAWPSPARLLAALFTLSLLAGYGAALLNVHDKTTDSGSRPATLDGMIARYRGEGWTDAAPGDGPMSYSHLVDITHVHAFSMPVLFFLLGGLFVLSACPAALQRGLIATSFTDLWLNMGALWGIRFSSAPRLWAGLLVLSGIVMGGCFAAMAFFVLRDLLRRPAR